MRITDVPRRAGLGLGHSTMGTNLPDATQRAGALTFLR